MERTEAITLTNMCMIYDDKGQVFVEEKIGKGIRGLIFPGGHVENHEPITDSMIREIYEETGLTISNLQLCGIKDWIEDDGSRYMVFLYKTNRFAGELKSSSEGEVFWMPLEQLRQTETLWHLDKMIEIFCTDHFSELFFDKKGTAYSPELK